MTREFKVKPKQTEVLEELERIIGKKFPLADEMKYGTFGVIVEGDNVVGLGLFQCKLTSLPESIGNLPLLKDLYLYHNQLESLPEALWTLKSLRYLDLSSNKLKSLPESIGNLSSLEELCLHDNQLRTLPASIGNLSSLQGLDLRFNQLTSLPESIGKLSSLKALDLMCDPDIANLMCNQLTQLPSSFWRLKSLEALRLGGNPWKGEWEGIDEYDIPIILDLCRQRASITIFISYSRKDKLNFLIKDLNENLKNRNEIYEIHTTEEHNIAESQLLLFIATKNSITDEQCLLELSIALNYDISIIPIKNSTLGWEELKKINLKEQGYGYYEMSDEKGLEFNEEENKEVRNGFQDFYDELYNYINQYKRDFNLFEPEERKIDQQRENDKNIFNKLIGTEELRENIKKNLVMLKQMFIEIQNKKISSIEYLYKWARILNSK